MRRIVFAATIAASSAAGLFMAAAPAAHADGSVCVHAEGAVNGTALPTTDQCYALPGAPALP